MKEREALKLALEALETCYSSETSMYRNFDKAKTDNAITAIKEALAQPEYQSTADKSQLEKVPAKGTLLAQQCVCGEPDSAGTHRTDGPCLAPKPQQCRKEQRGNGEYVCNCKSGECPELAQPEQEPVAWTDGDDLVLRQDWAERFDWQGSWVGVGRAIPNKWKPTLYTHPQPKAEQEPKREWVGLTDEEMKKVWYAMQNIMGWYSFQEIACAIEAKLKEKNT